MKDQEFIEYTIKIHKNDLKEYFKLENEVHKCLDRKADLKYNDLLALEEMKQKWKEYYSNDTNKKMSELINYFKEKKGFYFAPTKSTLFDDDVENEYKRRNKNKNNYMYDYYSDYELNFERNIRIIFNNASRYVFKEDKEYLRRLMVVICYLPFPKEYSLSKKKIIAGHIAAQYGVLKTEGNEPSGYSSYHKYLEDIMKSNVPKFDNVMHYFRRELPKKDYTFLLKKKQKK